jgi:hypothetical protein
MFKRRSAHGIFSSPQYPVISSPTNFVKLSGMGSMGEAPPTGVNSVIPDSAPTKELNGIGEAGAVGEPLVQDIDQTEALHDPSSPELPSELPQTPPPKTRDFQPLKSHPVTSSDDEETAPPPPDFTRRGIHIPTRTR